MAGRGTGPGTELREQLLDAEGAAAARRSPLAPPELPAAVALGPDVGTAARHAFLCLTGLVLLAVAALFAVRRVLSSSGGASYAELWLVFALVAPLTWLARQILMILQQLHAQACLVVISLSSTGCKWDRCLMDALVFELRKSVSSSCSQAIIETGDEDEEGRCKWQVSLMPLLSGSRVVLSSAEESLEVWVNLEQKDPVICGRAQEPRRVESARLRVATASWLEFLRCGLDAGGTMGERICQRQRRARQLVATWLQVILERYTRQKAGQVEVYELQEEYKDYRPSWELIRRESCCSSRSSGLAHYTRLPWAEEVRQNVDFALGHGGRARLTLFLSGSKGSGKTVFVEWLAGELQAPIYYIDLRSPGINDAVLRDAVARNRLRHNPPVLFHLDEFQAPLQQWLAEEAPERSQSRVTIQGLQCMLEGIATPNNAIFIFTSSMDLPALEDVKCQAVQHELQGLLRRFRCALRIPPLDRAAAEAFLEGFLRAYVAGRDWQALRAGSEWKAFAAAWQNWEPEVGVPFDMLSKYAERAVRGVFVSGAVAAKGTGCTAAHRAQGMPAELQEAVLKAVLDPSAVESFFEEYAGGSYRRTTRAPGVAR